MDVAVYRRRSSNYRRFSPRSCRQRRHPGPYSLGKFERRSQPASHLQVRWEDLSCGEVSAGWNVPFARGMITEGSSQSDSNCRVDQFGLRSASLDLPAAGWRFSVVVGVSGLACSPAAGFYSVASRKSFRSASDRRSFCSGRGSLVCSDGVVVDLC